MQPALYNIRIFRNNIRIKVSGKIMLAWKYTALNRLIIVHMFWIGFSKEFHDRANYG